MEKTSVALPAALTDGREGHADMVPWMERDGNYLVSHKKEGAAHLPTKKLAAFKTPTDVEQVLMDEYLTGERTRLVKEAVHKDRRSGSSDDPISPAEAAAVVLIWSRQLYNREIGNLLPNNRRQRRTCYALCHLLYPVSAAQTSIFRMDSNSTSYPFLVFLSYRPTAHADARSAVRQGVLGVLQPG